MLHGKKSVQGQTEIARLLNENYGERVGMAFNRQLIQRWRAGRFIPAGIGRFPSPSDGNRYDVQACCAWLESFIAARAKNPALLRTEETTNESKRRLETARANREERANLREAETTIEKSVALADSLGIVQRLEASIPANQGQEILAFVCDTLRSLGASPEIVSTFTGKLVEKLNEVTTRRAAMFTAARAEISAGG